MGFLFVLLLGVSLSLDSLAVSLSLGFAKECSSYAQRLRFLILIGVFHLAMIVAGWSAGEFVGAFISSYDHWLAFILLAFVGGKMIYGGIKDGKGEEKAQLLNLSNTLLLCLALSIDAFIAGFSLGLVGLALVEASQFYNVVLAGTIIGLCASVISIIGIFIGSKVSSRLGSKAEILGGVVLILIGVKVLVDHLSAGC